MDGRKEGWMNEWMKELMYNALFMIHVYENSDIKIYNRLNV